MKKIVVCITLISVGVVQAQVQKVTTTKKVTTAQSTKKPASPIIKTGMDSFSYALGLEGATYYKNQGVTALNTEIIKKAYEDVLGNKPLLLTSEVCNTTIQQKMQVFASAKAGKTKEEGKKFLADNKKRPGVIELPNGLQYEIEKAGTGPKPKVTDTIRAHYIGSLVNGKEFDNSYTRGQPIQIPVSGVIPGWVQALQMMPVGSKWKLFIPSDLGYGDRGAGNGAIPGGSTLVFEIELVEIVNK